MKVGELDVEIRCDDQATPSIRQLQRQTALTGLEIVVADIAELRAGLLKTMPDRMDALSERLDSWARGIMPAIRELRREETTR